jgi:hypothetical protein
LHVPPSFIIPERQGVDTEIESADGSHHSWIMMRLSAAAAPTGTVHSDSAVLAELPVLTRQIPASLLLFLLLARPGSVLAPRESTAFSNWSPTISTIPRTRIHRRLGRHRLFHS